VPWSDDQIEARLIHIWAETGKLPKHLEKANDPEVDPTEEEEDE
jgi:hypothetical protein